MRLILKIIIHTAVLSYTPFVAAAELEPILQFYDMYIPQEAPAYGAVPPSAETLQDLRLIKTDFQKYAGGKLNWTSCIEISPEYCQRVEKWTSTEILTILMGLKNDLRTGKHHEVNFSHYLSIQIQRGMNELRKEVDLAKLYTDEEDSEIKQAILMAILDTYFRDQLLWMGYGLLQPIQSSIVKTYEDKTEIKRLATHFLVDIPPFPDSLELWKSKQDYFCRLDQAARIPLKLTPESDLRELNEKTNIKLDYSLDYRHLTRFYDQSCAFLCEELQHQLKIAPHPDLIITMTKKIIKLNLGLHSNYQKSFPDLIVTEKIKADIETSLTNGLATIHHIFFENLIRSYINTLSQLDCIKDIEALIDSCLPAARKLHNHLRHQVGSLKISGSKTINNEEMDMAYQNSIHNIFVTTLNSLHQHYNERSLFTKTITSVGGRTSQTREFVKRLKETYQEQFPFLFGASTTSNLCLEENFAKLERQMVETDQSTLESAKKAAYSYWQTTGLSDWWNKK